MKYGPRGFDGGNSLTENVYHTEVVTPWIRILSLCLLITQVLGSASPEAFKTCQPGVA